MDWESVFSNEDVILPIAMDMYIYEKHRTQ